MDNTPYRFCVRRLHEVRPECEQQCQGCSFMEQYPSARPEERATLALKGIDRMLESVKDDLRNEDPGNHATISFLQGEGKGLTAAKLLLEGALRGHQGDRVSTPQVEKP